MKISTMEGQLKVSIITVVYNGGKTIEDTILSVASQSYPFIEHIIIDGVSTDDTLSVVQKHKNKITRVISEPDKGLYDAMNKGIKCATGDIIGILNADDVYYDEDCISLVIKELKEKRVDVVYGNLVYVAPDNLEKIIRYYNSESFIIEKFAYGMMPAHPTFFVYKKYYEKFGLYQTDYLIAADFELLVRFLFTHKASYSCLPKVLVKMRMGGVSTRNFKSNWILNMEVLRACKENMIKTNLIKIWSKYFIKLYQLIQRPNLKNPGRH